MKKCKIFLLMLMFTTGMSILSACSGGAAETDTLEKEQKKESSAGLSQFASENGEMWSDSWSTDTASGGSMAESKARRKLRWKKRKLSY